MGLWSQNIPGPLAKSPPNLAEPLLIRLPSKPIGAGLLLTRGNTWELSWEKGDRLEGVVLVALFVCHSPAVSLLLISCISWKRINTLWLRGAAGGGLALRVPNPKTVQGEEVVRAVRSRGQLFLGSSGLLNKCLLSLPNSPGLPAEVSTGVRVGTSCPGNVCT